MAKRRHRHKSGGGRKGKLRRVLKLAAQYRRKGVARPLKAAWAKVGRKGGGAIDM